MIKPPDYYSRLNYDEALGLFSPEANIHELGMRADDLRREMVGEKVYYILNVHINPTNVCQYRCELCAFSTDPETPRAYRLTLEEILNAASAARQEGCTEVHLVSGVDPRIPYSWYVDIIRELHRAFPEMMLKAFTAVEIAWMSELSGKSVAEVLTDLKAAGLSTLPGGGAEILSDSLRRRICSRKPMSDVWLSVHREAHLLGIPSTATILYGHVETYQDRVTHLFRLRELQDETHGFLAFIPLAFHPKNTKLNVSRVRTAEDDLRMIAASRLILDNIPHIKAYWISLGIATAQLALSYGASDLDGTVRRERIHHQAGSLTPEMLSVEQLEELIREAGRIPVQRTSTYESIPRK